MITRFCLTFFVSPFFYIWRFGCLGYVDDRSDILNEDFGSEVGCNRPGVVAVS